MKDAPRRILSYILVYKTRLIAAIILASLMSGCVVLLALLIGWFVDATQHGKSVDHIWIVGFGVKHGFFRLENAKFALMWIVAIAMVVIHIPKGVFTYANNYLIASVTNRVGADMRMRIYAHLQTLPLSFFHRNRIGDLMSRMSYDVNLIQSSSAVVTQAVDGPMIIIGGLGAMFFINWKLSMLTIAFVPLMGVAIDRLVKKLRSLTMTTQQRLADTASVVQETMRGVRIIKSFGMEEGEIKRFGRANQNSLTAALRAARRSSVVLPSIELMGAIAVALIILVGGLMIVRGEMSFSDLAKLMFLATQVAGAAKTFGRLNVIYQQTMAGAERIFEILDTKSEMIEDPDGAVLKDTQGKVEFRDVSFEYDRGETVLDGVSFKINPGEIVAIVGPSGAGKSTIADLIPRFYDVTGGEVLIEGYDVRHVNIKSLREQIGIVPQETILFGGTIADNIAYGRPGATMDEIMEVARAANAHDFIQQLPNGYKTMLGEAGVGLSGGQRQRLAIARALLKDPKILILDEATSSLDTASEGVVQEALDRLMRGRSTLVIAHRLSTVTNADRIIVLDNGRIVESGGFSELVGTGGIFAQLYRTQFRPEDS